MGILDHVVGNVVDRTSRQASAAIGSAIGVAATMVASEVARNITADMKLEQEKKNIQIEQSKIALEEQKKAQNLPPQCPHCCAPTNKKLVCEYCNCRII